MCALFYNKEVSLKIAIPKAEYLCHWLKANTVYAFWGKIGFLSILSFKLDAFKMPSECLLYQITLIVGYIITFPSVTAPEKSLEK